MKGNSVSYTSIDEYIATFPAEIQMKLEEVRATIKAAAPEAQEKFSYQMPTFYLYGNLIHFAAFKNHIGLFPAPSGVEAFKDELSQYATSKGTIRLPHDKPLPLDLISKITKYRVAENLKKAEAKSRKKKV